MNQVSDGEIIIDELKSRLLYSMNIEVAYEETLLTIITDLDKNKDGYIQYSEFKDQA